MTRVVLGSASTGRLGVLRSAGVEPVVIVSGVDEDAIIAEHPGTPAEVVLALAEAKAHDVASKVPADLAVDCVVIGCDSMLLLDGQLCGKPGTAEAARARWQAQAGRSGVLLTGHCVIRLTDNAALRVVSETDSTTVHFATPSDVDLDAYIASGEPLAVAGGFTLDGLGGWFVDSIEGNPSNVIGLSLPTLRQLLSTLDINVSQIWATTG